MGTQQQWKHAAQPGSTPQSGSSSQSGNAARRLGILLAAAVVSGLLLAGCPGQEERDPLDGAWEGTLWVVRNDQEQALPLELRLEQIGPELTGVVSPSPPSSGGGAGEGEVEVPGSGSSGGSVSGRRFEIREGLAAEGQVFFFASTLTATGKVTLTFHGRLEDGRLVGDVGVDVRSTLGDFTMPGRLEARRPADAV